MAYLRDVYNAKHLTIGLFPPRLRFNGFVEFRVNPDINIPGLTKPNLAGFTQTFSLPKIQFKNEVRNQYNIKRVATTGVDLTPVSVTMYDTVTNDWYELLMTYYSYMFMNPRSTSKTDSIANTRAIPNSSDTWTRASKYGTESFPSNSSGLDVNDRINLFDAVRMVVVNGQQGREITLHRPHINQMNFGEIDYASNDVNTFELEIEYENFVIGNVIENVLEDIDIQKFNISGKGVDTGDWAANKPMGIASKQDPFKTIVGKPMVADGLIDADRRSQPQVQPPKEKKPQSEKKGPRDKVGREIPS